jgi:LuxR family maltose regulon positive regulatory protein
MTLQTSTHRRSGRASVRRSVAAPSPRAMRFVETKLRPPMLRDDVIPRPLLLDQLRADVASSKLTLVSAPAGYGKTTALALLPRAMPDVAFAWLSLDEDDNDINVFSAALIESLRRVDPKIVEEASSLVPGDGAAARAVLDAIINDAVAHHPSRLVIVFDDFHRVTESAITKAIEYLLERMPPQLHVVIGTRHDPQLPLPRLRARQQLAEVRVADLRFSEPESRQLLNDKLRLGLAEDHVTLLQARTEGWAAGISLLVGALRRLPAAINRQSFLAQLSQLDRYIFDFLAAEVLDALSERERRFLLDISILAELSPGIVATVTQRDDAAEALQHLYARNLFVTALDEPPTVFRFHELVRDFLRSKLERDEPAHARELHRRAARAEPVFSRAVMHMIAAEDWDDAAKLIEDRGETAARDGTIATLTSWITALPDEIIETRSRLQYLLGIAAWSRFDISAAIEHFQKAVNGMRAAGEHAGIGPALVFLSGVLLASGEFTRAGELAHEATEYDLPFVSRLGLLIEECWLDMAIGRCEHATESFDAALDLIEAQNDPALVHSSARSIHCYILGLPHATPRLERFVRIAMPLTRNAATPLRASTLMLLAWTHQWRGRTEQAEATAIEAMQVAEHAGGLKSVTTEAGLLRATLAALRRDDETADAMFDLIFRELRDLVPFADAWMAGYLVALGRVRLLQGRIADARAAEQRIRAIENVREWPIAPVARALFRGLIDAAEGNDADAEASFRLAIKLQNRIHIDYFAGDVRVALAALQLRAGRSDEALKTFSPVLARHERYGQPGAVAWEGAPARPLLRLAIANHTHAAFATRVLQLMGEESEEPAVVMPGGDALTAREIEVLRLVADGASNATVAESLSISVHTVKRHVANLLQKLRVSSRAEAGAVARKLHLD